jgi:hypothetical protein
MSADGEQTTKETWRKRSGDLVIARDRVIGKEQGPYRGWTRITRINKKMPNCMIAKTAEIESKTLNHRGHEGTRRKASKSRD